MFLNKNLTQASLKLALPVMLTQLGQASVQLFDNIIVGKLLGANALASVSLGNSIFFSFFVFALGLSLSIPPLISEADAKGDHKTIQSVLKHGFIINLCSGVLLMSILLFGLPILYHLDQPVNVIPNTEAFLQITAYSIIPFMIFQTFREFSEGLSNTLGVSIATIAANIINIVLNYTFIKGLFGIPPMGVKGSALASLCARIFMLVLLLIILLNNKKTKTYLRKFSLSLVDLSKSMFIKMLRLGIPTSLQMFFEVTAFAVAAFICGKVSATDLAAHQVTLSMASFTFNLCIGLSVASTIMVGNKLGEKDFVTLRKIGINNLKIVFLFMALCGLIFIVFRNYLPDFYTKPEDIAVKKLASILIVVAALFQLSDGIQVVTIGALRGLQDVKIPSIITFFTYWVITIPLGYILCVSMKMGALGMWVSLGFGLTLSAVFLVLRFLKMSEKRIKENI